MLYNTCLYIYLHYNDTISLASDHSGNVAVWSPVNTCGMVCWDLLQVQVLYVRIWQDCIVRYMRDGVWSLIWRHDWTSTLKGLLLTGYATSRSCPKSWNPTMIYASCYLSWYWLALTLYVRALCPLRTYVPTPVSAHVGVSSEGVFFIICVFTPLPCIFVCILSSFIAFLFSPLTLHQCDSYLGIT